MAVGIEITQYRRYHQRFSINGRLKQGGVEASDILTMGRGSLGKAGDQGAITQCLAHAFIGTAHGATVATLEVERTGARTSGPTSGQREISDLAMNIAGCTALTRMMSSHET